MKVWYPRLIIVLMVLMITLILNFRYHYEPPVAPAQPVEKEIIIKYIQVPVPTVRDSAQVDSTVITLPKPEPPPSPDPKKYRRSKNLHKNYFVSFVLGRPESFV
jgi:hypothetical protein